MTCAVAAVLGVVAAAGVAALRWPFVGLLVYLWLDFMRPHDMEVALRDYRPMLGLGAVTLAAALWQARDRLAEHARALLPVTALIGAVAASALFSVDRAASLATVVALVKMLAVVWLLAALVTDTSRVRAVLWTVALSLGVLAVWAIVVAVERDLLREFRIEAAVTGPTGLGDGVFRDNNDIARILAFALPLWWILAAGARRWWSRLTGAGGALLAVAAIVCTHSRSGFIAMLVGGGVLALSARPRWRGAIALLGFVLVLFALAPRPWVERMASIARPLADQSFQGRAGVWKEAAQMVLRHPILGQGAGTFRTGADGTPAVRRDAHNVFLQVVGESGLLGLTAYAWVLALALLALRRVVVGAPQGSWLQTAARGTQAALLAYLTAGLALSGAFQSPLFVAVGLSVALRRCVDADLRGLPSAR